MSKDGLNPIGKMEAKLKHLEFIQGVVNRLAADSFRDRQQNQPPKPESNPRIASAKERVKPLARLLRCATAPRVTAPLGCGSDGWYGRKVPFGAFAPNMNDNILYHALAPLSDSSLFRVDSLLRAPRPAPPLFPREQRRPSDRPGVVPGDPPTVSWLPQSLHIALRSTAPVSREGQGFRPRWDRDVCVDGR